MVQGLRYRVSLVVVLAIGKGKQLSLQFVQK